MNTEILEKGRYTDSIFLKISWTLHGTLAKSKCNYKTDFENSSLSSKFSRSCFLTISIERHWWGEYYRPYHKIQVKQVVRQDVYFFPMILCGWGRGKILKEKRWWSNLCSAWRQQGPPLILLDSLYYSSVMETFLQQSGDKVGSQFCFSEIGIYGHTTLTVPDLVWSQKLSRIRPS